MESSGVDPDDSDRVMALPMAASFCINNTAVELLIQYALTHDLSPQTAGNTESR